LGGDDVRIRINRDARSYLFDYLYRKASLRKLKKEHSQLSRCEGGCMLPKKTRKKSGSASLANIHKEMAKPRMARSARIAELKLNTARVPEHASTAISGTVKRIIPSPHPSHPEKAQIAVDGADRRHRDLRFENTLTDEHGDDVKVKKGAHVDVTVTGDPKV
jgi:hypothetical protein